MAGLDSAEDARIVVSQVVAGEAHTLALTGTVSISLTQTHDDQDSCILHGPHLYRKILHIFPRSQGGEVGLHNNACMKEWRL